MVCKARKNLSEVENILVDAGYTGENFATQINGIIGATVEVIKRNELHKFVVLPKRWIVERSFAWLGSVDIYFNQRYIEAIWTKDKKEIANLS